MLFFSVFLILIGIITKCGSVSNYVDFFASFGHYSGNVIGTDIISSYDGGFIFCVKDHNEQTSESDLVVMKLDSDLEIEWTSIIEYSSENTTSPAVVEVNDGYVVYGTHRSEGSVNLLLVKLDFFGNSIFQKEIKTNMTNGTTTTTTSLVFGSGISYFYSKHNRNETLGLTGYLQFDDDEGLDLTSNRTKYGVFIEILTNFDDDDTMIIQHQFLLGNESQGIESKLTEIVLLEDEEHFMVTGTYYYDDETTSKSSPLLIKFDLFGATRSFVYIYEEENSTTTNINNTMTGTCLIEDSEGSFFIGGGYFNNINNNIEEAVVSPYVMKVSSDGSTILWSCKFTETVTGEVLSIYELEDGSLIAYTEDSFILHIDSTDGDLINNNTLSTGSFKFTEMTSNSYHEIFSSGLDLLQKSFVVSKSTVNGTFCDSDTTSVAAMKTNIQMKSPVLVIDEDLVFITTDDDNDDDDLILMDLINPSLDIIVDDESPFMYPRHAGICVHCVENYYYSEEEDDCGVTTCFGKWNNDSSSDDPPCYGNGECSQFDTCDCDPFYYGVYCNISECFGILTNVSDPSACGIHGDCVEPNNCQCDDGYFFGVDECNITTCYGIFGNETETVCSGHGICEMEDNCTCSDISYYGQFCNITCSPICVGGYCVETEIGGDYNLSHPYSCVCYEGWTGEDLGCSIPNCFGVWANDTLEGYCSGHGNCSSLDTCDCDDGYFGIYCQRFNCFGYQVNDTLNVCSGNGDCLEYDTCVCDWNYTSSVCSEIIDCFGIRYDNYTTPPCTGRGICVGQDNCSCSEDWGGDICSIPLCFGKLPTDPEVCNHGNGTCLSNFSCDCNEGYYGLDCMEWTCHGIDRRDTNLSCSTHGICSKLDFCECYDGYWSEDIRVAWNISKCERWVCNNTLNNYTNEVCSAFGECVDLDVCECLPIRKGVWCEIKVQCFGYFYDDRNACNLGNGTCVGEDICECNVDWIGEECQEFNGTIFVLPPLLSGWKATVVFVSASIGIVLYCSCCGTCCFLICMIVTLKTFLLTKGKKKGEAAGKGGSGEDKTGDDGGLGGPEGEDNRRKLEEIPDTTSLDFVDNYDDDDLDAEGSEAEDSAEGEVNWDDV